MGATQQTQQQKGSFWLRNRFKIVGAVLGVLFATVFSLPSGAYAAPIDFTSITFTFDAADLIANAVGFFGLLSPIVMVIAAIILGVFLVRTVINMIPQ